LAWLYGWAWWVPPMFASLFSVLFAVLKLHLMLRFWDLAMLFVDEVVLTVWIFTF